MPAMGDAGSSIADVYDVIVQVLDACRGKSIAVPDPDHPGKMTEGYERFGDVLLSAGLN